MENMKNEQYIIHGGKKLHGNVSIEGSKNAALPLIAAAIIPDEPVTLTNVPNVSDTQNMINALKEIGAEINIFNNKENSFSVTINGASINKTKIKYDNIKKIRASYYLIGALLAKRGEADVPMPGGCDLGNRPIDQHIKGFKRLGTSITLNQGYIIARTINEKLVGRNIFMDVISVGATINIMLAASRAKGMTVIINAAREPHVVDVAEMLIEMGVEIKGAGTGRIRIIGKENLKGTTHKVIPDQIEAATYMIAAAATGGNITLNNIVPSHLSSVSAKLIEAGCCIETTKDSLTINAPDKLSPVSVITNPHPGYPTDAQPQIAAALTLVREGEVSVIKENIFGSRFCYVAELLKMGADIQVIDNIAVIRGVKKLGGAIVEAPDLRAGAALIIAGLMSSETTYVRNIRYIKRGYSHIDEKLRKLGTDIMLEEY